MVTKALPENAPSWMRFAHREIGVHEHENDREIKGYARDAKVGAYDDTSISWCAIYAGAMLERAGKHGTRSMLARSYLKWGTTLKKPVYGCVAVLRRGRSEWQGHVGFYEEDAGDFVRLLSGNMGDSVVSKLFPKYDVLGYRWPGEDQPAERPATKVPDAEVQPLREDDARHVEPTTAAPVREQPAEQEPAAPQSITHKEVRDKLRTSGSRIISGVDRLRSYGRAALAWFGIDTIADAVQTKTEVQPLLSNVAMPSVWAIVFWCVALGLLLAAAYEIYNIEEARVDDAVNGQQARR
jgi:uncharacterized protein (TIGR02594 family)